MYEKMNIEKEQIRKEALQNGVTLGLDKQNYHRRVPSGYNPKASYQAYANAATERNNIAGQVFKSNVVLTVNEKAETQR